MDDGYWDLFWATGAPEFYLLRGQRESGGGLVSGAAASPPPT